MGAKKPVRAIIQRPLNESPSEKEGKFIQHALNALATCSPSMKVPPKRKGNSCGSLRKR